MKILRVISLLGVLAFGDSVAADHSVAVAPGGINLYSITDKGAHLVAGSPFTIASTGSSLPTAVLATMNSKHDFVCAIFGDPTVLGPNPLTVVGFSVTTTGLVEKWSYSFNVDSEIYRLHLTSIVAESDYVVFTYAPDNSTPIQAQVINQSGQVIAKFSGQFGENQPILVKIAPGKRFLYVCQYVGTSGSFTQEVSTYAFEDGVLGAALFTSSDPEFVQSECVSPASLSTP